MPTLERQTKRTRLALLVASAAVFLSLVTAGFALVQRFDATNVARDNNRHVWHAVICAIEIAVVKSHMPRARETKLLRFYDHLLVDNVGAAPCGFTIRR